MSVHVYKLYMCRYMCVSPTLPAGGGVRIASLEKPRDKANALNFWITLILRVWERPAKQRDKQKMNRQNHVSTLQLTFRCNVKKMNMWMCLTVKRHLCVLAVKNLVFENQSVVSVVCLDHCDVLHHVMAWQKIQHRSKDKDFISTSTEKHESEWM